MRRKAEDVGILAYGKDDNAAMRKIDRKDELFFKWSDYKFLPTQISHYLYKK